MPENNLSTGATGPSQITHHFAGGLYAKEFFLQAGQALLQHQHRFEHLSVLASGTVLITVDGCTEQYTGPACITIKAGQHHGIVAKTDTVWYCIHASDCLDADIVDERLIQPPSDEEMQAARAATARPAGGTVEQELLAQAAKKVWI